MADDRHWPNYADLRRDFGAKLSPCPIDKNHFDGDTIGQLN
jgi:hypothetical protein